MIGRVLKSTGSWYAVAGNNAVQYACRVRGKLRLEEYKESNPVAVGDRVEFEATGTEGVITEILPRENHMLRQSVKKTGHASVLAANIDQVLLLATVKQPRTSLGFIDRVLVSAESFRIPQLIIFRIPQLIIFNKKDLLGADELVEVDELSNMYQKIGIPVLLISAAHDADVEIIQSHLLGKVTLVAGHSGVGKSTLLNRLLPQLNLATSAISGYSEKGTHTTTFAEMFPVNGNTFIIDTPGIKEWGLVDMEQQEISDYFPEMREVRLACKFGSRCLHLSEPKCAVLQAVESGCCITGRRIRYNCGQPLPQLCKHGNRRRQPEIIYFQKFFHPNIRYWPTTLQLPSLRFSRISYRILFCKAFCSSGVWLSSRIFSQTRSVVTECLERKANCVCDKEPDTTRFFTSTWGV